MPSVLTFTQAGIVPLWPDSYRRIDIRLSPDATIAKGTILGEIGSSGVYVPYDEGNTDGSEVPKVVLEFDCLTDSRGFVWYDQAYGTNYEPFEKAQSFFKGVFKVGDLIGLDDNAAKKLGRFIHGDLSDGVFQVT